MKLRFPSCIWAGAFCGLLVSTAYAGSPVWKVSGPNGATLYLGASVHALKASDYPLPTAFNEAFEKSSRIVFEDMKPSPAEKTAFNKAAEYPPGDSLRNHVDPRTYDYLKRLFGLLGVPEAKFSRYTPWALTLALDSPHLRGLSSELGVEGYLTKRAKASNKPVSGLVSAGEHYAVYTGLTPKQAEGVLLLSLIPRTGFSLNDTLKAWRRGDVDYLWRVTHNGFSDYPAFGERILEARNRRWLPKLESYLASGETYFVVVGGAHLGGPEGVTALLRNRGYRIEQL